MIKYHILNRRCFAGALFSVLVGTVFSVVLQFFKGDVLDYAAAGDVSHALGYAGLLLGFILCEVFFFHLYDRFSANYVVGCVKALKQDIFASILSRSYVDYKEHPQGEYLAKYTHEADMIRDRRFRMLPRLWEILFKIILVSTSLFVLDWRIAIVTLGLLTTPLYLPKLIEKRLQRAQTAYNQAIEDNLAKVNDWLSGFEILKNYSIEGKILEQFKQSNDPTMEKQLTELQLGNLSGLITTLISYLSYFLVLACSTALVLVGDFSAGDFFVAIGMIDQLSYPLISLAGIIRQLIAIRPTCAAMEAFLAAPQVDPDTSLTEKLRQGIRFRNVSFSYDEQRFVLKRFDLILPKGKRYLLRGPSGCGKTTAINLLLKYYAPTSGQIDIDGIPIDQLVSTYPLITVVRQEAILFHDTLRNNLTLYRDLPDGQLLEVLKSVGLDRYAHPQALDSVITEHGANFSGGEKKRLCLARALLRDTDVLILDEPLANLDSETAERIENLLLSIPNKTLLIVSHQFTDAKLSAFDQVVNLAVS